MNLETIQLIDAALDANINQKDFDKLQKILRNDPVALQHYCEQAELNGILEWELHTPKPMSELPTETTAKDKTFYKWTAIAASVAALAAISLHLSSSPETTPTPVANQHTNNQATLHTHPTRTLKIARITNSLDAIWDDSTLDVGSWLKPGTISLLSGKAEITYNSGARVILQGSTELNNVNAHHANLNKGKGVVHIPEQAAGFRLETPNNAFADQDCSFALAVKDDSTEIHMIDGSIDVSPFKNIGAVTRLSKNESISLSSSLVLASDTIEYSVDSFLAQLPPPESNNEAEYIRWSFNSLHANTYPEDGNHRQASFPALLERLPNTSTNSPASQIQGKFGNAVRLNGQGSYLSTNFPGLSGAKERTITCWVRIPPQTSTKHSYAIFSWGKPLSTEGAKWQIAWNPALHDSGTKGALRTEFGGGYVVGSTNLRDGKWHHVASVFLGDDSSSVTSQVLHYVDGKLEQVSESKEQSINTRHLEDSKQATYIGKRLENDGFLTFKGDLDELYFFPSALTPAQIQDLYLHNKPPLQVIQTQH